MGYEMTTPNTFDSYAKQSVCQPAVFGSRSMDLCKTNKVWLGEKKKYAEMPASLDEIRISQSIAAFDCGQLFPTGEVTHARHCTLVAGSHRYIQFPSPFAWHCAAKSQVGLIGMHKYTYICMYVCLFVGVTWRRWWSSKLRWPLRVRWILTFRIAQSPTTPRATGQLESLVSAVKKSG